MAEPKITDAYIITGNPDVTAEHADRYAKFYDDVKKHVESLGLSAELDPGLPNTAPPGGKYWVGHSRGVDRLKYAPKGVQTLALDDYEPEAARARQAQDYERLFKELGVSTIADVPLEKRPKPGAEHYTFNDAQRNALTKLLQKKADGPEPAQTNNARLQQFLSAAELMGSRGRARMYGRPEPTDRDYDYIVFTDDPKQHTALRQTLRALARSRGYKLRPRPGGFLTASGDNMDLSFYPTAKKTQIHKAWALQEDGMSKDDAWAQIESEKQADDLAAQFAPDYTPEQLESLGVYDALYRGQGPRLASLGEWKPEWVSEHDPKGWAQWYKRYASGRRIGDEDERQIKRWLSFKARHGGPFAKNPTPRRGWALRNWGIDPAKLVAAEQANSVTEMLDEYKNKAMQKYVQERVKQAQQPITGPKITPLSAPQRFPALPQTDNDSVPVYKHPSGSYQFGRMRSHEPGGQVAAAAPTTFAPFSPKSPGIDSGPSVFRISQHGGGGEENYRLSNPGAPNTYISQDANSYLFADQTLPPNTNPACLISDSCNTDPNGADPSLYARWFNSHLKAIPHDVTEQYRQHMGGSIPTNTTGGAIRDWWKKNHQSPQSNLKKVVMMPSGYGSWNRGGGPQLGSFEAPYLHSTDPIRADDFVSNAPHEYRLTPGGDPTSKDSWIDTGNYTDARQADLPFIGIHGEAQELGRHLGLSPELGGGNFTSYLDKVKAINNNPDATYTQKVRSNFARPVGSAAQFGRAAGGLLLDTTKPVFEASERVNDVNRRTMGTLWNKGAALQRLQKQSNDLTKLAPKWSDRAHLLAALPKHLTDTQTAIQNSGDIDKEMTDLALISRAWLKSQRQKELLAARLKKFQETAQYPSLAAKTYYHGSPNAELTKLQPGSHVTPDLATAQLMGRFHEDTGKTWTDDDLAEPHMFGREPKWKEGREPKGVPTVYSVNAADDLLDLMDNPYEHKTKAELAAEKQAELIPELQLQKQASNAARRLLTRLMKDTAAGQLAWHGTNTPAAKKILAAGQLQPAQFNDMSLSRHIPLTHFHTKTPGTALGFYRHAPEYRASQQPLHLGGGQGGRNRILETSMPKARQWKMQGDTDHTKTPHIFGDAPIRPVNMPARGGVLRYAFETTDKALNSQLRRHGARLIPPKLQQHFTSEKLPYLTPTKQSLPYYFKNNAPGSGWPKGTLVATRHDVLRHLNDYLMELIGPSSRGVTDKLRQLFSRFSSQLGGMFKRSEEKQAELIPELQLQAHQQRIADRVAGDEPRMLVYHGLGSGKSLSALAAAEAAKKQFGDNYGIAVPASLRGNFQKEINKFTRGSNPEIMSYTGLALGKQFKEQPDTLIMDEAHRLRNPDAASSRGARAAAQAAKRILLLTGSPITNSPSDLANLLGMLHNKKLTPEEFEKRYIDYKKVNPGIVNWFRGIKPGEQPVVKNEKELRALLKGKVDYQPSKTPEGVDVQEEVVRVPLSPQQQKIQKAIRTKVPPGFLWKLDSEFPLSRDELAKLNSFLTGMRQVSLSTQPFRADKDPAKAFEQSAKLQEAFKRLKETLDSDKRKKAIIYSNFIDSGLAPYAAGLERAGVPHAFFHGGVSPKARQAAVEAYNKGKLRALLIGPAGAEGLSTKGTSLIQLMDPHWHESRSQQARGRGLRFDSHRDLPEELKNVAVQRFISSSEDPSWLGKLMGYSRERTGDEVLERLTAEKERLNEVFRKILREEGQAKKTAEDFSLPKIQLPKLPSLPPDVKHIVNPAGTPTTAPFTPGYEPYEWSDEKEGAAEKQSTAPPQKKKRKKKLGLPSFLPVLGGLGALSAGTAYGLASDEQTQRVLDAAAAYNPTAFTEGKLPPNHTGLTYYQKTLTPGAALKPFGVPVGELLTKLRSSKPVMEYLGTGAYHLPDHISRLGGGGLAHYSAFAAGPVPAYMHQIKSRLRASPVPVEFGVAENTMYSDWMGRKFEDFIAGKFGPTHPYEVTQRLIPHEKQIELIEDFHKSLPEDVQKYRIKTENPGAVYAKQTGNYLPKAVGFAKLRNQLKNTGIVLGGSSSGGVLGHFLAKKLRKKNPALYWSAVLGGAGFGGAAGYFGGTSAGREKLVQLLANLAQARA